MTCTEHRPPLQAVNPPQHDDRAAWQLDRRRFAAFLTAKDLVLGYTRTATEGAGRLAARLHLPGSTASSLRSSRQPPTGPSSCSASVACCDRRTCPPRQ